MTIKLVNELPSTRPNQIIGQQITRSATSVGANYRASCRAKSRADRIYKLKVVEEEADETLYWLELLRETDAISLEKSQPLFDETNEILAMTIASIRTLRAKS